MRPGLLRQRLFEGQVLQGLLQAAALATLPLHPTRGSAIVREVRPRAVAGWEVVGQQVGDEQLCQSHLLLCICDPL